MRALVTGANGFLGRHVVGSLLARGFEVRAMVRPAARLEALGWPSSVEVFRADLRTSRELGRAFEGVDVLLHLAAVVSGGEDAQFAGTVAGIPVRGTSVGPSTPEGGSPTSLPARLTLATWTGTFEGHRFALDVSTGISSLSNISTLTFDANGSFDSQKVRFIVGPDPDNSTTIRFHGTVGRHDVLGSLRLMPAHGARGEAIATFTVTT